MGRSNRIICAALLTFPLAACGGGGGGEVASLPPPPPTPPGVARAPVSAPVMPTETFTSLAASVGRTVNSHGSFGPYVAALAGPNQTVIGRDAAGGYAITLPLYSQTADGSSQIVDRKVEFSADTLEATVGQKLYKTIQSPKSSAANYDSILYIYEGRGANYFGDVGLEHVSFGQLQTCNTATGTGCNVESAVYGAAYFTFGDATQGGEIPLSGTAGYSGKLYGFVELSGDVSLSINFASQSVSGAFTNMKSNGENGPVPIADLDLSGSIGTGGTLSGTLASGSNPATQAGQWNAAFFGPAASEIGGAFLIEGIGESPIPGVFGLRKK